MYASQSDGFQMPLGVGGGRGGDARPSASQPASQPSSITITITLSGFANNARITWSVRQSTSSVRHFCQLCGRSVSQSVTQSVSESINPSVSRVLSATDRPNRSTSTGSVLKFKKMNNEQSLPARRTTFVSSYEAVGRVSSQFAAMISPICSSGA